MHRLRLAALTLLLAGVASATAASAATPQASRVSGTYGAPVYLFFLTPGGSLDGGLTAAGCPFLAHPARLEAQTSTMRITVTGRVGPLQNPGASPGRQVNLRARLKGTVEDASGNVYSAVGSFLDASTHYLFSNDLLFDGAGTLTLSGPAGSVTGTAEFRNVNAPPDYSFTFTDIRSCTIRPGP
jgi:hypothetical protein